MALLSVMLAAVCYYDYKCAKIPNWLLAVMFFTNFIRILTGRDYGSAGSSFVQSLAVTGLLYPLFKIGAVGAGDVKLFGVCAGWLSSGKILSFLFFSLMIAAIISILKLLTGRTVKERLIYFCDYMMTVARTGKWHLYLEDGGEKRKASICLSGPVLCSVLLCWGGIY